MEIGAKEKPTRKVARLMVSMGTETSGEIMKHLPESEVEEILVEIANISKMEVSSKEEILQEYYADFIANDSLDKGGLSYAQEVLNKAFGADKARALSDRLVSTISIKPFYFLKDTAPDQLVSIIKNEHPQTIALVLTYLDRTKASKVLCSLETELQTEVGLRIATMDRTTPEVISKVEKILERKISNFAAKDVKVVGGTKAIVGIINQVDRNTEKMLIKTFEKKDKKLAEEIKAMLFVFEDIIKLDDRAIQAILKEVDTSMLGKALKTSNKEVKNKIFKNMSERASLIIQEDMESLGPMRITEVEQAQQTIVKKIKELEDKGDIIIARGGSEVLV